MEAGGTKCEQDQKIWRKFSQLILSKTRLFTEEWLNSYYIDIENKFERYGHIMKFQTELIPTIHVKREGGGHIGLRSNGIWHLGPKI